MVFNEPEDDIPILKKQELTEDEQLEIQMNYEAQYLNRIPITVLQAARKICPKGFDDLMISYLYVKCDSDMEKMMKLFEAK